MSEGFTSQQRSMLPPFKNVAIALDQAINCLIHLHDGWGMPDEMLSARAWRLRREHPRLHVWIDRLFWFDRDHCEECYQIELYRRQSPRAYREVR